MSVRLWRTSKQFFLLVLPLKTCFKRFTLLYFRFFCNSLQLSLIWCYSNYTGVCPKAGKAYPYLRPGTRWQGLAPGKRTSWPHIYNGESAVQEAAVDHLFMKSKLCGNTLSTVNQLKVETSRLNISSLNCNSFWVLFKGKMEESDARQVKKERGHCRWCKTPI